MRTLLLFLILSLPLRAKDLPAADVATFDEAVKAAQPGDVIILREGEWVDAVLKFKGEGTKTAPLTLRAAVPGKTRLTGRSALRIGGTHLVVDGLHLHNQDPAAGDIVEFRLDSKKTAQHCRLTNSAITQDNAPTDARESHWLGLYGADNRVDHCLLQGKTTKGTALVVWLGEGQEGRHRIDHNYFGPREKLGENGGEIIRVGDSKTSMLTAACVVERNLFEKCNGEAECISNKSCGNLYRENTFREVSGTLTLRHGNGCTVERNVFLGNEARGTGGIRIIGEDHVVRGNYLEKLAGDDARSGVTLMMGIPNSPLNRYFQVKRARVEKNTFVDCKRSILIGLSDDKRASLAPVETTFIGNVIHSPKSTLVEARCEMSGVRWEENVFTGKTLGIPETDGITDGQPEIVPLPPIARNEVGPEWFR
jgi:poly(beta-D-mannuronate) lyase